MKIDIKQKIRVCRLIFHELQIEMTASCQFYVQMKKTNTIFSGRLTHKWTVDRFWQFCLVKSALLPVEKYFSCQILVWMATSSYARAFCTFSIYSQSRSVFTIRVGSKYSLIFNYDIIYFFSYEYFSFFFIWTLDKVSILKLEITMHQN